MKNAAVAAFFFAWPLAVEVCLRSSHSMLDSDGGIVNLSALHQINKQGSFMRLVVAVLPMLLVLAGCTQTPPDKNALLTELDGPLAQMQVDGRQLYQRMQKLTADKSCSSDKQCQAIGIGAKPCGGPEQFLVFSNQQTDQKMLAITNDRYSKIRREQQQRLGLRSICQQLTTPAVACRDRQCIELPTP